MEIHPGDIYWVAGSMPQGSEPGIPHPQVVVRVEGRDGGRSLLVCALTTNRKRLGLPGNVLLEPGEANLPRRSVVEVSKVSTLEEAQLGEFIGSLTQARVEQILAGVRFVQRLRGSG